MRKIRTAFGNLFGFLTLGLVYILLLGHIVEELIHGGVCQQCGEIIRKNNLKELFLLGSPLVIVLILAILWYNHRFPPWR